MDIMEKVKVAVKALDSKKAVDIKVIDVADVSSIADYFIVASGNSSTHVKTLADEAEFQLVSNGFALDHIEGRSTSWILLDFDDVVIHVLGMESRGFYDLERLWADGKDVDISEFIDA
ncbi:MAG: ribosome silencing factor [Clostridia bacterium]|nr:ribosome silencing factor [Clostridia bacterium]